MRLRYVLAAALCAACFAPASVAQEHQGAAASWSGPSTFDSPSTPGTVPNAALGPENPGAPGSGPGQPTGEPVPLDGGMALLALAGLGLGVYTLRRKTALAAVALVALAGPASAQAPAVLSPGDIVVLSYYTSNGGSGRGGDNAIIATTVDMPQGTTFEISDGAYRSSDDSIIADNTNPGEITFLAPCDIPAGTVFKFDFDSEADTGATGFDARSSYTCPDGASAATGLSSVGDFRGISGAGDQILIFQNAANDQSDSTTGAGTEYLRFVYAVTTRNDFVADYDAARTNANADNITELPPLLDVGSTAIFLTTANSVYEGYGTLATGGNPRDVEVAPDASLRVGSRGDLLLAVGDVANNWAGNNVNTRDPDSDGNQVSGYLAPTPPQLSNANATITRTLTVNGAGANGAATAVGGPGWRNVTAPGSGLTVNDLVDADINWIQGLEDEHPVADNGQGLFSNLYIGYNGDNEDDRIYTDIRLAESGFRTNLEGFVPPRNESIGLEIGKGVLWYFYDVEAQPLSNGETTSRVLPVLFPAIGTDVVADVPVTFTVDERTSARTQLADRVFENGFYFLGNPFRQAFDLSGVSATGGSLQAAFTFWNPNAGGVTFANGEDTPDGNGTRGSYVVRNVITTDTPSDNVLGDDMQVWQGFYAEINGAATDVPAGFTLSAASRVSNANPTFYGRRSGASPVTVGLRLSGDTADGPTYDEASQFYFHAVGTDGWDPYDLSNLGSMSEQSAMLRPLGIGPNGEEGYVQMQRSLSRDLEGSVELPVQLNVTGAGGTFEVSWHLDGVPDSWALTLTDAVTGAATNMRTADAYAFDAEVGVADRFTVTASAAATAGEGGADGATLALTTAAPNPTGGVARVTVSGLTDASAEVAVYDALGRQVALLHSGAAVGGRASLSVDAERLAPGVYTIRARTASEVASTRLVVIR